MTVVALRVSTVAATVMLAAVSLAAQQRDTAPAPLSARAAAPVDLTGVWVSVITESWRWRMVTPAKGDVASIPITPKALKEAEAWDPVRDEARGEQCRAYGAAGLMRMPGRLRISWADDHTLKVEMDTGTQTRLLHFGPAPRSRPSWQGSTVAQWIVSRTREADRGAALFGYFRAVTTSMRPGYLRKNGVPYSAEATMTEFWDVHQEAGGEQWLVITSRLDDPEYLQEPFLTSPNFRKEPDGAKWLPGPCEAR